MSFHDTLIGISSLNFNDCTHIHMFHAVNSMILLLYFMIAVNTVYIGNKGTFVYLGTFNQL